MKTLSDKIQIRLNTGVMTPGYARTTLYHNSIGVFTGRSFFEEPDTNIIFNMNDIVDQNHGKNDCLKLNDEGKVETMDLNSLTYIGIDFQERYEQGMVGPYTAAIQKDNLTVSGSLYAVSGYDYPNKDIRPRFIWQDDFQDEQQTTLCRVMQGCDWIFVHDEEVGIFNNGLIPHYPYVLTEKFGFGLQLWTNLTGPSLVNNGYGLQGETGTCYNIGVPYYTQSSTTFVTLKDLISGTCLPEAALDKNVHPIYLRYYGSSGDEFGDWEEGIIWYKGKVNLDEVIVRGYKDGSAVEIGTYDEGATFNAYVRKYILATRIDWNYQEIINGNREVFVSDWGSSAQVNYQTNNYINTHSSEEEVPRSAPQEFEYDYITVQPSYSRSTEERKDPDVYVGKCPVGILDSCYSRYYLAWNDRYGDIMSQPFDGKVVYSEDIETEETADYLNRRKVSHVSVKPKWKLNTKWLNQDVYPYYEAIFSSPYLLLYDTQTDRSWNVIVTDNKYEEKTNKTQKSLFNLELNVEANENQNMIY